MEKADADAHRAAKSGSLSAMVMPASVCLFVCLCAKIGDAELGYELGGSCASRVSTGSRRVPRRPLTESTPFRHNRPKEGPPVTPLWWK